MTNLITQATSRHLALVKPTIVVRYDEEMRWYTSEFGTIGSPHYSSHRRGGPSRPCVHALSTPPSCELFTRAWTAQLSPFPTLYKQGRKHVIASRTGNLVNVAFDVLGPVCGCTNKPTKLEESNRFCYTMFPVRFEDEPIVCDTLWLGVWPD